MDFPQAIPLKVYEIDGALYERVPASEGINNPTAIRAGVEIQSGEDKGGWKICWFVQLDKFSPACAQDETAAVNAEAYFDKAGSEDEVPFNAPV